MRYLGTTARAIRDRLGLTQQAVADSLGVTVIHWCNIENDKSMPSAALLAKFRETWGIDLYVVAWCAEGETSQLPNSLREAAENLRDAWSSHVETALENAKLGAGRRCSTSRN